MQGADVQADSFVAPAIEGGWFPGIVRYFFLGTTFPSSGRWQFNLPGGSYWRVRSALGFYTSTVAVANRFPGFRINDNDANEWYVNFATVPIPASSVWTVTYAPADEHNVGNGQAPWTSCAIPKLIIPGGFQLVGETLNAQVGDTWSQMRIIADQINPTELERIAWAMRGEQLQAEGGVLS